MLKSSGWQAITVLFFITFSFFAWAEPASSPDELQVHSEVKVEARQMLAPRPAEQLRSATIPVEGEVKNSIGAKRPPVALGGARPLDFATAQRMIRDVLAQDVFEGVTVGFLAENLHSGLRYVSTNENTLFVPASNQKILTTAAVLETLGPDYRFETDFVATKEVDENGLLESDLYVIGSGDPFLVPEQIDRLGYELEAKNIRKIKGNLIVDDSLFEIPAIGPGFDDDESYRAYRAPQGALSVNFNSVAVTVMPGVEANAPARIQVIPPQRYTVLDNQTKTVMGRMRQWIRVETPMEDWRNKIVVTGGISGNYRPLTYHRRIDNVPIFSGWTIHDILKRHDIRFTGTVKTGKAPENDAVLIHRFESLPLSSMCRLINKYSNNFMAEMVLLKLGAVRFEAPGNWEKGAKAMAEYLKSLGIDTTPYLLSNGSGMGDVNRISPSLLVSVLRHMALNYESGPEFVASLTVSGVDGTLATRYDIPDVKQAVRGKTGTLSDVMALSGYVLNRGCERVVFSLLFNGIAGKPRDRLYDAQVELVRILSNSAPDHPAPGCHRIVLP